MISLQISSLNSLVDYAWKDRTPSATARRRTLLTTLVKRSFEDSDDTYGYPRASTTFTQTQVTTRT